MFNLDNIVNKNNKNSDKDWPFRMLIIGPSGSGKTNALLHLIENLNNSNPIEYSDTMDDAFENIDEYNTKRKRRILIVFDDMIADIMPNKKFQSLINELFIRCRKLNISIVFNTQFYFKTPKDARLNSAHNVLMKIQSRRELQNIAHDNSGDIDFKDFLKIYKDCTKESYFYDY